MTTRTLAIAALLAATAPAAAQGVAVATQGQVNALDRRVGAVESQLRAVQRRVFPGGDRAVAPEAPPPSDVAVPAPAPVGTPAAAPLVDLTNRVDALERQQRALTGQVEQLQFRQRQLEESLTKLRGDAEFRLNALESGAQPAPSAIPADGAPSTSGTRPARTAPAAAAASSRTPTPTRAAGDDSSKAGEGGTNAAAPKDPEAQYTAAYRLYTSGAYPAAETALAAFAKANPKHPRASNARFWQGRAIAAQGRHAAAAEIFLNNYKDLPRGERASNSLLWLAKSLVALDRPNTRAGACDVLKQLAAAYPDKLTGALKTDADATRTAARCS